MKTRRRFDTWHLISFAILGLYAIFLVLPLFLLLRNSVIGADGFFSLEYFREFFTKPYYYTTLFNSFFVSVSVTVVSLVLGTLFAYFYNLFEIKGRTFLQTVALLCSMSPPVIGAYSWIQMFGRSGLFTKLIKSLTGFRMPDIYGFGGIVLVITCQLFQLVFLYVSGGFFSRSYLHSSMRLWWSVPNMCAILPSPEPSASASNAPL